MLYEFGDNEVNAYNICIENTEFHEFEEMEIFSSNEKNMNQLEMSDIKKLIKPEASRQKNDSNIMEMKSQIETWMKGEFSNVFNDDFKLRPLKTNPLRIQLKEGATPHAVYAGPKIRIE